MAASSGRTVQPGGWRCLARRLGRGALLVPTLILTVTAAVTASAVAGQADPAPAAAPVTYRAPVPLPLTVLRGFDPPANPYGPGHLGVDLAAAQGTPVRSAASGVVTFAGQVAGRGVVVVLHPDGIRTEYEPLEPQVTAGEQVAAGAVLGVLHGAHPGCPLSCLHWGARRGTLYLDPLSLLRPLGPVRLLPWQQ